VLSLTMRKPRPPRAGTRRRRARRMAALFPTRRPCASARDTTPLVLLTHVADATRRTLRDFRKRGASLVTVGGMDSQPTRWWKKTQEFRGFGDFSIALYTAMPYIY
jgi:hypothetical protein